MAKNSYPELPVILYKKTTVPMDSVIAFAKTLLKEYPAEYIGMAYAIFRNESANGTRGVNNNYAGIQADVGRWTGLPGIPVGTCVKVDSGKVERRFLCFDEETGYKVSFKLIVIKAAQRSMKTPADYFVKWVGRRSWTQAEEKSIQSMLNQAINLIK